MHLHLGRVLTIDWCNQLIASEAVARGGDDDGVGIRVGVLIPLQLQLVSIQSTREPGHGVEFNARFTATTERVEHGRSAHRGSIVVGRQDQVGRVVGLDRLKRSAYCSARDGLGQNRLILPVFENLQRIGVG